jgi:hypothetical protein
LYPEVLKYYFKENSKNYPKGNKKFKNIQYPGLYVLLKINTHIMQVVY